MRTLKATDEFRETQESAWFPLSTGPIAFYLSDLNSGGVQRIVLKIAQALADRGYAVDLVVCKPEGELSFLLGKKLNLHVLKASSYLSSRWAVLRADSKMVWLAPRVFFGRYCSKTLPWLPALAKYLADRRPSVLFAATPYVNLEAVLARRLAKVLTRIVACEHGGHPLFSLPKPERCALSVNLSKLVCRSKVLAPAMRRAYLQADRIVAVSHGLAESLVHVWGIPNERIEVIYNPVVGEDLFKRMREPIDHPWFCGQEIPVVVAVGGLARRKDYPTLLHAFARLRRERAVRLAILGSGNDRVRGRLESLVESLGIAADVAFLGFVPNPLPYMARANLLVLSSLWEGLPTVLIEALACGTPVVSTDCPSGPAEILEGGRYGRLVPVGDDEALATAMAETLDYPPEPKHLRKRAADFDEASAILAYQNVLLGFSQAVS